MAKKKNPVKIAALIGGVAILGYVVYKKYTEAAPMTATTTDNTPLPATTSSAPSSTGSHNGIPDDVYSYVYSWATGVGATKPPVIVFRDALVPSEYQGLYTLYTNFWSKGIDPTPDYVDFWDDLRSKYDPTHKYW